MEKGWSPGSPAGLEDYLEAYETAQMRFGRAEPEDFLPDPDHPLYLAVLGEVLRADLEYSWKRGTRKRPEDYRERYPGVFEDQETLKGLAYEEYRQRRQLGENPSPAEYQQRFGFAIGFWPRPRAKHEATAPPGS
jgi:hypothetical protein